MILETPKNIREVSVRSLKNGLVTYILITSINHVGYVNFQKTKCFFNENLTFQPLGSQITKVIGNKPKTHDKFDVKLNLVFPCIIT